MSKISIKLQDNFLNQIRKEQIPVIIYLLNGYQMKGFVEGFDNYIILIKTMNKKQQIIYKHGISTISPIKSINLSNIIHGANE